MADLGTNAKQFHWLLDQFVANTAGVLDAIAVSSDGLLLATSSGPSQENAEQLAAVTAGLGRLRDGAAHRAGGHNAHTGTRKAHAEHTGCVTWTVLGQSCGREATKRWPRTRSCCSRQSLQWWRATIDH